VSRIFVDYRETCVVVDAVLETSSDFVRLIKALEANKTLFDPTPIEPTDVTSRGKGADHD
jgi:hypothetical protein